MWPETFGNFAPEAAKFGVQRPTANSQKPAIGGHFWRYRGENLQATDCLAGDAVLIAPVSRQIPWYQGILQGILLFWGSEAGLRCKKPLSCSDFSGNSLRGLSGKII